MKLDRIDKKLLKLGFEKIQDNHHGMTYHRYNKKFNYMQVVTIWYKANGQIILQSYDSNLFDTKCIGNTCVGLNQEEVKLFCKKIKKMEKQRSLMLCEIKKDLKKWDKWKQKNFLQIWTNNSQNNQYACMERKQNII